MEETAFSIYLAISNDERLSISHKKNETKRLRGKCHSFRARISERLLCPRGLGKRLVLVDYMSFYIFHVYCTAVQLFDFLASLILHYFLFF